MTDLRHALDDYLTIRRSLGYKLERTGLLLADFVAHLEANEADTITTDAALAWATLPANGVSNWWAQRRGARRRDHIEESPDVGSARGHRGRAPTVRRRPPRGIPRFIRTKHPVTVRKHIGTRAETF